MAIPPTTIAYISSLLKNSLTRNPRIVATTIQAMTMKKLKTPI
jgi:uncharacterized protein YneF (UPF0154 family)